MAVIVETRSISLEYLSFKRLKAVYEEFLANFPTTLEEDLRLLREERKDMTPRMYWAVMYRTEQKKILNNQIRLVDLTMHIL